LLIYLTSGLFLRKTELVTLRYLNNKKNLREIFLDIESNLFIINISYYKKQGFSKKKASNICYLYSVVSCIFLLYIILVDIFIEFIVNVVYQDVGHIITSDTLTEFPTPFIPYVFSLFFIMSVIIQEAKIILAIEAIRTSKKLSYRKATKFYQVSYSIFCNRMNG
jgi:hypothetical protein